MQRSDEDAFLMLLEQWHGVAAVQQLRDSDAVLGWERDLIALQEEEHALRNSGLWRSGARTLLQAMRLHHMELPMTAGLAWLLRPDGHHGLGDALLLALLERCGVSGDIGWPVEVVLEETRGATRADLVVRTPAQNLLIESKVGALEQPAQCERLADLWADEAPLLLYLTRHGDRPTTAGDSLDLWHFLRWSDIAQMLQAVTETSVSASPGVHEYLDTLNHFYGRKSA